MKKIIMDIDSAGDDILAVLYMACRKEVELIGITTVTGACGDIKQATWVALNTLEIAGSKVPVYEGADCPVGEQREMDGDPVNFDEELRWKFGNRLDRFNEQAKPPQRGAENQHAVEFLIEMIHKHPGEITVITTGPLTNLALALTRDSSIAGLIKEAYVLGGCFQIYGNITPVVEYNIFADPEAAKKVLNSDMPISLIPLDVCENNKFADGMLTRDHLSDLERVGDGPVTRYVCDKFPIYIDLWREYFQLAGFPMDDVITAAAAVDETLFTYGEPVFVDVELEGELTRGQTIAFYGKQINKYPMKEHKNTKIATKVDGKRFMDMFTETLSGR